MQGTDSTSIVRVNIAKNVHELRLAINHGDRLVKDFCATKIQMIN